MNTLPVICLFCAGVLTLVGCSSLALSQAKHWKKVAEFAASSKQQRYARRIGWSCLSAAFPLCIVRDGLSFAVILWPLLAALMSFIVAMALSFFPGLFRPFTRILG